MKKFKIVNKARFVKAIFVVIMVCFVVGFIRPITIVNAKSVEKVEKSDIEKIMENNFIADEQDYFMPIYMNQKERENLNLKIGDELIVPKVGAVKVKDISNMREDNIIVIYIGESVIENEVKKIFKYVKVVE